MLNTSQTFPIFIHICAKCGLKDPFLNRDEYGNMAPVWEDCDEWVSLDYITWFKFIDDDNGNRRVSISSKSMPSFGLMSDQVEFFEEWLVR